MKYEKVITSFDIQNAYIKFYSYMMQYLWNLDTVMNLAKLEIAIYKRFPNKEDMENYISLLERNIKDTYRDPEDESSIAFKKAFEHLKSYIDNYDVSGLELASMQPAISSSDLQEVDSEGSKIEISVGKVVKR